MIALSEIQDVVDKFSAADKAVKSVYPKVDVPLVVNLFLDKLANKKRIYTMEIIIDRGEDTEEIRKRVIAGTGMAPAFYLEGTKMIISHPIDLEFLKRINDLNFVVRIKGSPYGAGGATDF